MAGWRLLWGAVLLAAAHGAPAQGTGTSGAFPDLPWGSAGAVLGSGATAHVSDATAVFWNPARLVRVPDRSFLAGTGDLYGRGLVRHGFASVVLPRRIRTVVYDPSGRVAIRDERPMDRAFCLATDVVSLDAFGDAYRETRLHLTYARRSIGSTAVGVCVKYLSASGDIEGLRGSGYDVDLGWDGPASGRLRAGLIARHVASRLSWDGGGVERLNTRLAAGLTYIWGPRLAFPAGVLWEPSGAGLLEASLGAEGKPRGDLISLFAGLRLRPEDDEEILLSAGMALFWKRLRAGYGLTAEDAGLGETHRFHVGLDF